MGGSCSFFRQKRTESEDSDDAIQVSPSVENNGNQRPCSHHRYSRVDDNPDAEPPDKMGITSATDINSPSSTRKPFSSLSGNKTSMENITFSLTNHEGMRGSGLKGVRVQSRPLTLRRSSRRSFRSKSSHNTSYFQPNSSSTPCAICYASPSVSLLTLSSGLLSLSTAVQGNSARLAAIQDSLYLTAQESPGQQHSPPSPAVQSGKRLKLSLSTTSTTEPPCSSCPGACSHANHDDTTLLAISPGFPKLSRQTSVHPPCRRNLLSALDKASEETAAEEFPANHTTVSNFESDPLPSDKEED